MLEINKNDTLERHMQTGKDGRISEVPEYFNS